MEHFLAIAVSLLSYKPNLVLYLSDSSKAVLTCIFVCTVLQLARKVRGGAGQVAEGVRAALAI